MAIVDLTPAERRAWSERVLQALDQHYASVAGQTVEIHAGMEYRESGLESGLR